jgi:choline dehydrogenase-like flavoprotein
MADTGRPFSVIAIGSGFGGTMTAMAIAAHFKGTDKRVLMLERGTWWTTELATVQDREVETYDFLKSKKQPVQYWASADDFSGVIDLATRCLRRTKNEDGLYELSVFGSRGLFGLRTNDGVSILRACGVGGGSLVYSNITIQPPDLVFEDARWPARTRWDKPSRDRYFDLARDAIGYDVLFALEKRAAGANSQAAPDPTTAVNTGLSNILNRSTSLPEPAWRNPSTAPGLKQLDPARYPNLRRPGDLLIDRGRIFQVLMSQLTSDYGTVDHAIGDKATAGTGARNYCERQGRCNVGCLPGARNTLNKQLMRAIHGTYAGAAPLLADVLQLEPLAEVQLIRPRPGGGYEVEYLQRDQEKPWIGRSRTAIADRVIVAAGCVGTTELLLRCKERGTLPHLSDQVGFGFSTNGDYLAFLRETDYHVNLNRGPVTTSFAHFNTPASGPGADPGKFHTIEDQGIPRALASLVGTGVPFMQSLSKGRHLSNRVFIALTVLRYGWTRLANYITALFRNASVRQGQFGSEDERTVRMMCCVAMGRDASLGRFRLGKGRRDTALRIQRDDGKQFHEDPIYREIDATLAQFAQKLTSRKDLSFENPFLSPASALLGGRSIALSHPLGGCIMGTSASDGVVDELGRVFDASKDGGRGVYPGLYITDAAAVPTALGVNPSLTISALALRAADTIIEEIS